MKQLPLRSTFAKI